jgi:hypothetical protein
MKYLKVYCFADNDYTLVFLNPQTIETVSKSNWSTFDTFKYSKMLPSCISTVSGVSYFSELTLQELFENIGGEYDQN